MDSGLVAARRPGMTATDGNEPKSRKPRFNGEIDGFRPLAGFDLLAVGGLNASNFEAPIGAHHGEAVGFYHRNLANLAGDPLRVFRRQRLSVENFQLLAIERGPGAGCRIAAANEPVDLLPRLA